MTLMLPAARSDYTLFVGIDVAAKTVTAAWTTDGTTSSRPLTIAQTPQGYTTLHTHLQTTGHPPETILVVMEATGTYWITLAMTLVALGYAVSVINPRQAHHFAKALLKRAKTDAVDAYTLACLAARLQPTRWTPPPVVYTQLQQRLTHRDALVTLRTQVRNQLHALEQQPVVVASVRAHLEELIQHFTAHISEVEQEIAAALRQDAAWATAAARLQTITGIGLLTAATILTATVKFTLCPTADAATAYAGLAPNPYQSGTSVRGRATIGHAGNSQLRRVLYLASLSATRYNPSIKPFYDRLRAAGKPAKVARCAAARKLLHIAWAVVTKECDFDPTYGQQTSSAVLA
jgi:transposase